jgi:hypothetical protein
MFLRYKPPRRPPLRRKAPSLASLGKGGLLAPSLASRPIGGKTTPGLFAQ